MVGAILRHLLAGDLLRLHKSGHTLLHPWVNLHDIRDNKPRYEQLC